MNIIMIESATRVLGEGQGYIGLPLRDELIDCSVGGEGTPSMVTAWQPTMDELMLMLAGAPILLRIIGTGHPPVMLSVGEAPPLPRTSRTLRTMPRSMTERNAARGHPDQPLPCPRGGRWVKSLEGLA